MNYSLSEINNLDRDAFVAALGAVYEDTPAIAEKAWYKKPFVDLEQLHQSMVDVVKKMSDSEQLILIRSHPDLGSKAKMAEASVKEQAGIGLDRLTSQEFDRFQLLNDKYKEKFGFPFIIAVKNQNKMSIFDAFELRLQNAIELEKERALLEIFKIAKFRLLEIVIDSGHE
jgi:2-oxo-4-hydroxy-4-carboxy-5-ureidoimidazoline decarboxylase